MSQAARWGLPKGSGCAVTHPQQEDALGVLGHFGTTRWVGGLQVGRVSLCWRGTGKGQGGGRRDNPWGWTCGATALLSPPASIPHPTHQTLCAGCCLQCGGSWLQLHSVTRAASPIGCKLFPGLHPLTLLCSRTDGDVSREGIP